MSVNAIKDDEDLKSVNKSITLSRLFKYMLAYKLFILIVLVIMLMIVTISIINPLLIERAIDVNIANKDMHGLFITGAIAVAINVLFVGLVKLRMYLMAKITNDVLLTIRQELYTHIQKLSFSFFDSRPTGKILARIIGDVNSLKDVLSNSVTTLIPDFITICAVVTIMLVKNWRLALASLISLPLMIFGLWLIQLRSYKKWMIHRKKSSNLNAFIHEDLSGMRIIQSFTAEEETKETFDQLLKEHRDSFVDAIVVNDAFGSVIDFCWGVGTISMYYVAIKLLGVDAGGVGTLVAFGYFISMFWHPIMNLSNFYNQLITNIAGAERIFDIMDTKPEIEDTGLVSELPPINGEVCFDHVSFAYDEDTKVLNDVSFKIKPG
ncbi:MAG: ABC transporter ATP-binding protein, partial [Mobilitalea sp.]